MVVERQSAEVALLKSRGAGKWHIMTISALKGCCWSPWPWGSGRWSRARRSVCSASRRRFTGLPAARRLTVALTGETYLWAAGGALLSLVALLWPAWRSNRANVVHYVRSTSRPQDRPAFQRYYLDLVVVAVGALLFFQLQDSGSLVTEDLFGGLDQDPLLLIAPAVFVVTVAVVFLRLFPCPALDLRLDRPSDRRRLDAGGALAPDPRAGAAGSPRPAVDHGDQPGHVRRHLWRDAGSLVRRSRRLRVGRRAAAGRDSLQRRLGADARRRPRRCPRASQRCLRSCASTAATRAACSM